MTDSLSTLAKVGGGSLVASTSAGKRVGHPPGLRVPAGDPPDPGSCGGPRDPGSCGGPARSGFLLGTRQIRVSPWLSGKHGHLYGSDNGSFSSPR